MSIKTSDDRREVKRALLDELVSLARALGDESRRYVILGEGNVSVRVDDASFFIKASGASMATATVQSLVQVDLGRVLALVQAPQGDDATTATALQEAVVVPETVLRPSVETGMHAILLAKTGKSWIAHTHPTAIAGLLCSRNAEALVAGALFPDQVVVCGEHPLLLPYVDPGIPLARALAESLDKHIDRYGLPPKAIYLQNHGFVAVGGTPAEVLAITAMAEKAAVVLSSALGAGGPSYLPASEAARIAGRSDEHYRQRMLGLTQSNGCSTEEARL